MSKDLEGAISRFMDHLNHVMDKPENFRYILDELKVRCRVVRRIGEDKIQDSVYCFIDFEGNIYKAASWKTPAKGVRASVFDEASYKNANWAGGWLYR